MSRLALTRSSCTSNFARTLRAGAVAASVMLAAGAAMPALAQDGGRGGDGGGVNVARVTPKLHSSGHGEVRRSPDQVEVTLGVSSTGKTTREATDTLNATMKRIVDAVKALNDTSLVVQTQTLSLNPQYRHEGDGRQTQAPEIIGYTASNTVRITSRDVGSIGNVIDKALGAGANEVQGISFSLKDDADAKREAIMQAAQDAKTKADALASALGVTIAYVLEANTEGSNVQPFYPRRNMFVPASMMMESKAAPTVVESGEVVITADVSVTYLIKRPMARGEDDGETRPGR